jgi:shikimate dehydrogenase
MEEWSLSKPLGDYEGLSVVRLIGHPVQHSLSPIIQNAAFKHSNLALSYVARDIEPKDLANAVDELRACHCLGANITLPHKEHVLHLVDEVEIEAARVGAVNTVVNREGILTGYNTDVQGFSIALRDLVPQGAEGLKVLVLGAGGAARAVVAALVEDRAARIYVANRSLDRAETLCRAACAWGDTPCLPLGLDSVSTLADEYDVIVNATSLGLPHSVKDLPLDVDILHSGQVLFDLVYGPGQTSLVHAAITKGLRATDGKAMLVQQAALAYELWIGADAPLEIMRGSIGC